ncbi:glycosyltransferase BC10 [Fagus crenata]
MLSPTPLSLLCALLLCLPLAIVYTIISATITTTYTDENPETINLPRLNNTKNHQGTPFEPNTALPDDDESLFQVASRVNPIPCPQKLQPKKLAFMFLTNIPLPFAPLWELYFNNQSSNTKTLFNIYIHADPTYNYDPPFSGVFAHRVIPSKHTRRFTPTLISAARRLLAHALLDDPANAMFALISPSCIPIHSFDFTYKTVINSDKSFIEILNNEVGEYDRWAARGEDVMLPEVKLEEFRIGSQFWILTRKHARLVVSDRKLWSKFKLPCVRWYTCYPEENYFSTLLNMRDPLGCVPTTLTHVDWRGRFDGHPRTYKASVVGPELIVSIRRRRPRYGHNGTNVSDLFVTERHDPFLFARKFSFDSIRTLMSIANDVIFKN